MQPLVSLFPLSYINAPMTNQAGECAPLGAAHGNEIDTKDAGFVIMVGLVALLLLVAFACGAFFSCWCLGGSGPDNKKKVAWPWQRPWKLARPLEFAYVTKHGKYIHLTSTCPWLATATTEQQVPVCPKCVKLFAPGAQK